jgi:dihydroorotate dehydrogenase
MKLRDLDFGASVFGQSGVQGFFGEGGEYPHHSMYKNVPGFSFEGISFVAKTVTLKPRIYPDSSNTELIDGYKIKRLFPSSIWWSVKSFIKGYMLNAVGLANPGLERMLDYNKWQKRRDVFQLSIMLMESNQEAKIVEAEAACTFLNEKIPFGPKHRYAIQINESCPNTGHEQTQHAEKIKPILQVFRARMPDVPIILKLDLLVEPLTIIALKEYCDAFCISNTIPFGKKENQVSWGTLFKKGRSPLLKHFNGKFSGGLSGAPLFPVLERWLETMDAVDSSVIIIAGGGIMTKGDIFKLMRFHIVRGVALGSVAILRPWRLAGLIDFGNHTISRLLR